MEDNTSSNFDQPTVNTPDIHPPAQGVVYSKGGKKKTILILVLSLLVALGAAGGVYAWQHGKAQQQKKESDNKLSALQTELNAAKADPKKDTAATPITPTAQSTSERLVAGQIDFNANAEHGASTAGTMYIQGFVLPANELVGVWAEYGQGISKLDKQTEHITKELGLGEAGQYANYAFTIRKNTLEPGVTYYYRIAAQTKDGMLYSGTAAFTNKK